MENLVDTIFWLFIGIAAIGVNLPILMKHKKVTGDVVNYDPPMRKFVYKVYMYREEIISSLKIMNVKDDLSCTFDLEKNTVLFSDLTAVYSRKEYFYEIQECDGFSILKLSQVSRAKIHSNRPRRFFYSRGQNNIPYMLNPFMVRKINAEIIPFSQYGN